MKKLLIILSIIVIGILTYFNISYNKVINQTYNGYTIIQPVNLSEVKFDKYQPSTYSEPVVDDSGSDMGVPNQVTFGDISTSTQTESNNSNNISYNSTSNNYSTDKSVKPNGGSFSNMPMLYSSKNKPESTESSYQIETNHDEVGLTTESSIGMTDRQNCNDKKNHHGNGNGHTHHGNGNGNGHTHHGNGNGYGHHDCNPLPVGDLPIILLSILVITYIYFKHKK